MQDYYLQKMGITPWVLRQNSLRSPEALLPAGSSHLKCQQTLSQPSLQNLAKEVEACTRCPLHLTRTQTVFARGNPKAQLMIIGEAPGYYEDQQGKPFVGAAGGLLDLMITSVGFEQDQVYIANVLKCRPPNNRDPQAEEIAHCSSYLAQQIAMVQPKLILALGRFAGQYLLNTTQSLASLRMRPQQYQNIPVIVSYHPAYLLRNPADKKKAYLDWQEVQKRISWAHMEPFNAIAVHT